MDRARAEGANFVVALGHLGTNGVDPRWQAEAVIKNTSGIDVLLDGHSHEQYEKEVPNKDGKDVVLVQTGTALASVGKIIIDTQTGEISSELVKGFEGQDPDTLACVAEINAEHRDLLQQSIGQTKFPLTISDIASGERAIRSGETNLGDLTTDAYRAVLGTDIAITNSGMIRANISAGAISNGDLLASQPFNGDLCVIEATGQQIYEALEMGSRNCPEESGGFLQVSGLQYTIDCAVPSPVVTDENGAFMKVDGEARVKDIMVGGSVLDLSKTYTVATNVYIVKYATDGYTNFRECNIVSEGLTTLYQSLIDYVRDVLDGVVGEEYRNPYGQGRITVLNADLQLPEWYESARYVIENGIMVGIDADGRFAPDRPVTSVTVYQVLYNIAGRPSVGGGSNVDIGTSRAWYEDAITWAAASGVHGADSLDGNSIVSKVDAIQMVASYFSNSEILSDIAGTDDTPFTRADLAMLLFSVYQQAA